MTKRAIRIGNASGFCGDRIPATREMVEAGPLDVVTGDYLAELTMLILWKARRKDPSAGYAKTFLTQLEGMLGIAAALEAGADIVICPRVTDASLTVGPAAWWHGWSRTDYDALAGAIAAGHVIECGPQACGGNYSFPDEIGNHGYPGFPIAEVDADGSSVITKHDGTA